MRALFQPVRSTPWLETISQIESSSAAAKVSLQDREKRQRKPLRTDAIDALVRYTNVAIRILERPTPTTAVVEWSAPTTGHYGQQNWRTSTAKAPGFCAMSGRSIRRGDPVFRPSTTGHVPQNADAMICARLIALHPMESGPHDDSQNSFASMF